MIGVCCSFVGNFFGYSFWATIGYFLILPTTTIGCVLFLSGIAISILESVKERRWKKMPKAEWDVGSIFIVPNKNGFYSIGQVISRKPSGLYNVACCAFFNQKGETLEEMNTKILKEESCISVQRFLAIPLDNNTWPVIGKQELIIEEESIPKSKFGEAHTRYEYMEEFLSAYHGFPSKKPDVPISYYLNFPQKEN